MKNVLFILGLLFFSISFCFSQNVINLSEIFSDEVVEGLQKKGKVEKMVYGKESKDYEVNLFPNTEHGVNASKVWEKSGKTEKPVFVYEGVYLVKKDRPTDKGEDIEEISRLFRSMSSLEGISYYSHTRKKYRELYKTSYTIDDPKLKNRIPDKIEGSADGLSIYALQEDSTFGKFVYRYDYSQSETELLFKSFNIDPITLLGFKIIDPEEFRYTILVTDVGDSVLMYALVQTDVISVSMIEDKMKSSFAARVEALYSWFVSAYSNVKK